MPVLTIRVDGEIRGKGRHRTSVVPATLTSKARTRTYTPTRTENAENHVKWCAITQVGQPMLEGPLKLSISVFVEIPGSWSKVKKQRAATGDLRPATKPDFDNSSKLICDALNKIVWKDDAQIVDASFSKQYAAKPGAIITVETL